MLTRDNHRSPITLQWRHNERNGVLNHQAHDCLLNRLFRHRSNKASKLRVTGLCEGNSPVTGEFPAQRASNAENVSIWWRLQEAGYAAYIVSSKYDINMLGFIDNPRFLSLQTPIMYIYIYALPKSTLAMILLTCGTTKQGQVLGVFHHTWRASSPHGFAWGCKAVGGIHVVITSCIKLMASPRCRCVAYI